MNKFYLKGGLYVIAIGLIAAIFCSCNKESACLQYATISAKASFKSINDTLLVRDTLLPQPIIKYGKYYSKQVNSNSISLLLNTSVDTMNAVFSPDSAATNLLDTLQFIYTRQPTFISKECGFQFFFILQKINFTKNHIKNIIITTAAITDNNNARHFQIYY